MASVQLPLTFTITDSFILGSDKHIHDRDMAWLLKSDGKLDFSLFINFLAKRRLVVKRVILEYWGIRPCLHFRLVPYT